MIGAGEADEETARLAFEVGRRIGEAGARLICGGLSGVMAEACRGAISAGGLTVGILPGRDPGDANPWVTIAVPTGLGELRNGLVVLASQALVAVGGEYGTLSEIALALKAGRPLVGLRTWSLTRPSGDPDGSIVEASSPADAVARALALAGS